MAILFMEGFDGFINDVEAFNDSRLWTTNLSIGTYFDLEVGRSGTGKCIELKGANIPIGINLAASSTDTVYSQLAYNAIILPTSSVIFHYLSSFYDESSDLNGGFRVNDLGKIEYFDGSSILATSTTALSTSTWYYIEMKVKIHPTAGTIYLKIDGVEDINATGLDTQPQAGTATAYSKIYTTASAAKFMVDDVVIGDDSGAGATDLLGECIIEAITPDGAGNYTDWTPSAGSNFQNVDEFPNDAGTT